MEEIINLDDEVNVECLFGNYDENIALLQKKCYVTFVLRENKLKISGDENNVMIAKNVVKHILKSLSKGEVLTKQSIEVVVDYVKENKMDMLKSFKKEVCTDFKNRPIYTKTFTQKLYFDIIDENTITFGVGMAGTGKTYIAVAKAVSFLKEKNVDRIVITRPVVEAGESLGFLPGDFQTKIDPYLRPLYDIMEEIIGIDKLNRYLERKKIEIVPLAYMRGRTLSSSFIILDEAQNTTSNQMKMFLTRLGNGSKMVITGDVTQIDLVDEKKSGLLHAITILKNIKNIGIVNFSRKDVVRHELVQNIIKAYENI